MAQAVKDQKNIWIDLGNTPHVLFFEALAKEFESRGHRVLWTARDYAQTVPLAAEVGINAEVIGRHGGKGILSKLWQYSSRVYQLLRWARGKKIDLVVSHSSQEPLAVARLMGISSVNLMDYEHHPANHVSFRMAKLVIVPSSFPDEALRRFGVTGNKVRRFDGIKEDVYLAAAAPNKNGLPEIGVTPDDILVVIRPHASEALYHRGIENELLSAAIDRFAAVNGCKIILLPRTESQKDELRERHPQANVIMPETALHGRRLVGAADLVVSCGGTMNREAAALGVPTATLFMGQPAAIDDYLVEEGRMVRISTLADLHRLAIRKKEAPVPRGLNSVRSAVADLILEAI